MLTNKFYLRGDLLPLPQAIFMRSPVREKALYYRIKGRVESGLPVPERDLQELANFPFAAYEFVAAGALTSREAEIALDLPAHRFDVLLEDYSTLAPIIERPLERDFESLERLVRYFRAHKIEGLHPQAHYLELLKGDPDRYLSLVPTVSPEALDQLLAETIEKRRTSPEHAYHYLKARNLIAVDQDLERALVKSDQHAYLAARHLKDLGQPANVYDHLLSRIDSGRWLYHALRDGMLEPSPQVLEKLTRHPGWAVEWLVRIQAPIDRVLEVYALCQLNAEFHPLGQDLMLWFTKYQFARFRPAETVMAQAG